MKNFIFQSFPMRKHMEKNNIMIRLEKKEEQREVDEYCTEGLFRAW